MTDRDHYKKKKNSSSKFRKQLSPNQYTYVITPEPKGPGPLEGVERYRELKMLSRGEGEEERRSFPQGRVSHLINQ